MTNKQLVNDIEQLRADIEEARSRGDLNENSEYAEAKMKYALVVLKNSLKENELKHKAELKVQWKPPTKLVDNRVVMGTILTTNSFGKVMIIPHWEYSSYEEKLRKENIIAVPSNAPFARILGKELNPSMKQEVYNG